MATQEILPALALFSSFGIAGTSKTTIEVGSPDDLLDAFRRHTSSSPERYTLDEFRAFVAAVVNAGKCELPGLIHCGDLLTKYMERIPDLGWERAVRQVWPLLSKVREWVESRQIPLDKIGVRPMFVGQGDGYKIIATLCDHTLGDCTCGLH